MKVYYLWHKKHDDNYVGFDANTAVVVLAHNAKEARTIAAGEAQAEGKETWLDTRRSACEQAHTVKGGPQVLIAENAAG